MTMRLILSLPDTDTAESLAVETLRATLLTEYAARWAGPMPGTSDYAGRYITDVLCADVPLSLIAEYAPDWVVLGAWRWDGVSATVETVVSLAAALFVSFLTAPVDEFGVPTGDIPGVSEIHRWAGWPACF